jgi:hypothetical protein
VRSFIISCTNSACCSTSCNYTSSFLSSRSSMRCS